MADNVAISAGSGTTIGTDERSINSTNVQVQRVDEQGSTSIASAQANVTNSHATLVAARETRKRVIIINRQATAIFVGPATVTTANGVQIDPGASLTLHTTALIDAVTAASSAAGDRVHTIEEFDA